MSLSANNSAMVSEDVRAGALSLLVALPALNATLAGSTKSSVSVGSNTPAAGSGGGSQKQRNHVLCAPGSSGCDQSAEELGASSALAPAETGQAAETARRLLRSSSAAGDPEVAQSSWVLVATGQLAPDTSDDLQVCLLRSGCRPELEWAAWLHSPGMQKLAARQRGVPYRVVILLTCLDAGRHRRSAADGGPSDQAHLLWQATMPYLWQICLNRHG